MMGYFPGRRVISNAPSVGGGAGIQILTNATNSITTGTSLTVNVPSGTVDGDFLLAVIACRDAASISNNVITPPGGAPFTTIQYYSDGTVRLSDAIIQYRRASSEPASYTWTCAADVVGGGGFAGVIIRMSGVIAAGNPEDSANSIANEGGGGASFDVAGITTTANGSAVFGIRLARTQVLTCSAETMNAVTIPEIFDGDKIVVCGQVQTTAGATGNFAGTDSVTNDRYVGVLAIKAA